MRNRVLLLIVTLAIANCARANNNIFRIAYDQGSTTAAGTLGDRSTGTYLQLQGDGNTLRVFTLQWDFSRSFGVFYRNLNASGVQTTEENGSLVTHAFSSISGHDFGLEARYSVASWGDLLARVNFASLSVDSVEHDFFNLGEHLSESNSQTYFSVGARIKISDHFGAEAIDDNYKNVLGNVVSLGLYLQF